MTLCIVMMSWNCAVEAARISEPDTAFYGKIVQRLSGHEFLVTSGELVWKITTSGPAGAEYQFTTQLQSLAGGRYCYQLRLAHQLLAYDLAVVTNKVAVTASGTKISQITASLNGQPLVVLPQIVGDMNLTAELRAAAYRVDLEFAAPPLDSDGDGFPDWWEDAHGLDKWNASDAPKDTGDSGAVSVHPAPDAQNFAEWRAALFPSDTSALQIFGELDSDEDGLSNFLEYAFDLDPRQPESNLINILPHMVQSPDGPELVFRKRLLARDVEFRVDVSSDLVSWTDGTADMAATTDSGTGQTTIRHVASNTATYQFFRVRVRYLPAP